MTEPAAPAKPARRCPICGKPATDKFAPFCSGRCQDVDLHRWLSGTYRAPTEEAPEAPPQPGEDDED